MKLPVPVAGLVAGTLVLSGVAVAGAALVTDDGTRLPAAAVASSGTDDAGPDDSSPSSTSSTVPGAPTSGDLDRSGPCDEAEHAGDPRCAAAPVSVEGTGTPAPQPAAGAVRSFPAADAGTVSYTVDGTGFHLVAATPAAGWAVEVEQASGDELDLDFRRGTVRVQVDVELEDGQVRERVRVRDDATDDRSETEVLVGSPAPTTTPTTVDDDDDVDRDDRVEDGDDRSGPSDDDAGDDDTDDTDDPDDDVDVDDDSGDDPDADDDRSGPSDGAEDDD